jgi:hypothetical protein
MKDVHPLGAPPGMKKSEVMTCRRVANAGQFMASVTCN